MGEGDPEGLQQGGDLQGPVGTAGASGGDGGGASDGSGDSSGQGGEGEAAGLSFPDGALTPLRFAEAGTEEVWHEAWYNGTFTVQEHSYPKGMVTHHVGEYDPDRREWDVSPDVPKGYPVRITAEVDADLGMGDLDLWFDAEGENIMTYWSDSPFGGYTRAEATVLLGPADPLSLVLRYDEVDDSTEFDYAVHFTVHADPWLLPDGVPVGLRLEPGQDFVLQFLDEGRNGGERSGLLWDPRDELVGSETFTGSVSRHGPGETRPAGEYVLFLTEGSGAARIALLDAPEGRAPPMLRALGQDIQWGDPVQVPMGGTETAWGFDLPRTPLQVGLFWEGGGVSSATTVRLTGPDGEALIDDTWTSGDTPWLPGPSFGYLTDMGVPGLDQGRYEAYVSFDTPQVPHGLSAHHVAVYYAR